MLYRFTTRKIGNFACVSLIGLHITDEIPLRSALWSMYWPVADTYARDQFYLWLVERIDRMVAGAEFKRQVPPIAKLGPRTAGIDYLYPRRRPRSTRG